MLLQVFTFPGNSPEPRKTVTPAMPEAHIFAVARVKGRSSALHHGDSKGD
jgi:hypothetical protein